MKKVVLKDGGYGTIKNIAEIGEDCFIYVILTASFPIGISRAQAKDIVDLCEFMDELPKNIFKSLGVFEIIMLYTALPDSVRNMVKEKSEIKKAVFH